MTIAVKILNDQIKKISETNTLLDMLLEFEKTLDSIDLYAFANWDEGEVLEGPTLGRHHLTVKLMYPHAKMPDPDGAKRLIARDCLVEYTKDKLIRPKRVRNFDDLIVEIKPDGMTHYKAKTTTENVWVVEIKMPRRYVDEFNIDKVKADEDSYVDMEDAGADAEMQAADTDIGGGAGGVETPGELV
jgi:hypothetical protein